MFEQSYETLKMQVAIRYGSDGSKVLQEFHNNEILDTITHMSNGEFEVFYQIITKNFIKTEQLLDRCSLSNFVGEEERFDYDSFYHNCYQKLAKLINDKKYTESKELVMVFRKLITNIKTKIKSPSNIKECLTSTYKVKDKRKVDLAKKIYQFKLQIENYFKRLVRDCDFDIEVVITVDDVLMLVDYLLNSVVGEDILSQLSFVNGNENLLNSLRNYEDEFKEILGKLAFDENNNFVILTKNFREEELEIYLYILQELDRTKKVDEKTLLDSIFSDQNLSLQKIYSDK